ncbi:hypothetical protein [Streptomyces poriferorum]|uniref:ABC transporter permease n=1 Tax=Streptomyces poriferorum TaxID=2798799 RepID=A0ABY9IKR2_9ACTN|nr:MULTISPECIES: hypothetical protein [unclassified Streptomyces]MDP5315375.1 hypothetical protein [Streptomyces sp. Alt4]WLQ55770.1 hypothetical protein P8A19_10060 [Streptomyces sp. Alt2]
MTHHATPPGTGRKLTLVVLALAALIAAMLCAFALPSLNSGPHHVPIGVTGPGQAAEALRDNVDGPEWDVRVYETSGAVETAVRGGDIAGGLAITAQGVDVYTATAGGPSATSAITALGDGVADQNKTQATVHDLVPFTDDDPRGAGLTAALMPMIFGGIFPALILGNVFPGHRGLRLRLAGALTFSVVAGAAVAAVLQFGTHSIDGNYGLTALGIILGMAALSTTLLGLQARFGMAGFAFGGALMMLLGNPLSGLATGPHWLPDGWGTVGQLLPPGASGSLLRANAFFDGAGGGLPALVLTVWVVIGVGLALLADRRGRRTTGSRSKVVAGSGTVDASQAELATS